MPLTPAWTKSSHSDPNGGNCVEARQPGIGTVQVRDTKNPRGPVLSFGGDSWDTFTAAIRTANLDA